MAGKKKSEADRDPAPRKPPGTDSAKALVAAVLTAAGELLIQEGPSFTTNDVAKRAGVSIGSLYQYFPNKEAILAEATRRVNESFRAQLSEIVDGPGDPVEKINAAVDLACSDRFGDTTLRKALFMNVPRSWSHTTIVSSETAVLELLTKLTDDLVAWRKERGEPVPPDGHRGVSVTFFMVRGAVQGALMYQPELLEENRLADMVRPHLLAMLLGRAE